MPAENIYIEQLLQAREIRMQQKLNMIQDGYHLVSLQLNIPGLPKSNDLLKAFFILINERFQEYYQSRYCTQPWNKKYVFADFSGDWGIYLFNNKVISASYLKEITEEFEQTFTLGRIVDLDILDCSGTPISSGKAKPCFICNAPAEECRKTSRHDIKLVRDTMLQTIQEFMDIEKGNDLVKKISGFVTYALLQEVSLSPKPGLVCRNANGAHTDMDYASFLQSIAMISPYFIEVGKKAISFDKEDLSSALPEIREIGIQMERAMHNATDNVNTHKGAIFLMAISIFAIIRVIRDKGTFNINEFSETIKQLTSGIVQRELSNAKNTTALSHGQECFNHYGLQGAGARGEAEHGMPTVTQYALPLLNELLETKLSDCTDIELNKLLIPVLLKIISVNNDTNVLYRKDKQILENLKLKAEDARTKWQNGDDKEYNELIKWCIQQNISPGGSADLLALTLLLHQCQEEY